MPSVGRGRAHGTNSNLSLLVSLSWWWRSFVLVWWFSGPCAGSKGSFLKTSTDKAVLGQLRFGGGVRAEGLGRVG